MSNEGFSCGLWKYVVNGRESALNLRVMERTYVHCYGWIGQNNNLAAEFRVGLP